jgi:hypothetical protein
MSDFTHSLTFWANKQDYKTKQYPNIPEMREWCEKDIGKTGLYLNPEMDHEVGVLHHSGEVTFYFKSEEAYNWFKLRWK